MIRILLITLLLVGCAGIETAEKRATVWDKAEMINVKYYKSETDPRYLQTFEMDGYKFVIFFNNRGSAMQAIALNNDAEYVRSLEKENELLGSKLTEFALDHE